MTVMDNFLFQYLDFDHYVQADITLIEDNADSFDGL